MQVVAPLLQVLVRLHIDRIVHRDIKPENLFLTRKRQLKLGDLGLAIVAAEELPFTRSGTLDYMAPEVTTRCTAQ
jgi:serine/threonine protein kinase